MLDKNSVVEVSVHEAKTHLSALLVRVESGENIVIARSGRPIAKLVALPSARRPRKIGNDAITIASDFNALPKSMKRAFGMQ
jgi:prevent-host-death family protein